MYYSEIVDSQNIVGYSFPGYRITPGTYYVSAYAHNRYAESKTTRKTIMISKAETSSSPAITPPENTTIASGSNVRFVIDSTEADMIAVRYFTPGNTNYIYYDTKSVQENQNETTWSQYFDGTTRKYSFAARKDGIWSEWSGFVTITSYQSN